MIDPDDFSAIGREAFLVRMSNALKDVRDIEDPIERLMALCRAGYSNEQIIDHADVCTQRERIRRSIANMKEKVHA